METPEGVGRERNGTDPTGARVTVTAVDDNNNACDRMWRDCEA